jgi:hypothetical protein
MYSLLRSLCFGSSLALISAFTCAEESQLSGDIGLLLEKVKSVSDIQNVAAIFSALTLKSYVLNNPNHGREAIDDYQFSKPEIFFTKTLELREHILVAFPQKVESPLDKAAFVIVQKCRDGSFISLVHGFVENRKGLIEGFKLAGRDSSADYYKWNACSCVEGGEDSD